jgi:hypothetical protein
VGKESAEIEDLDDPPPVVATGDDEGQGVGAGRELGFSENRAGKKRTQMRN